MKAGPLIRAKTKSGTKLGSHVGKIFSETNVKTGSPLRLTRRLKTQPFRRLRRKTHEKDKSTLDVAQ